MRKLEYLNATQAKTYVEDADQRIFSSVSESLTTTPLSSFHKKLIAIRYKRAVFALIFIVGLAVFIGGFF